MTRSVRAAVAVARACGASAALAVVLLGVPWFLAHSLGWPWPRPVPTAFSQIGPWLAVWRIDRGRFVLDLLGIAGWGYWLAFVRQLVVQLPGAVVDAVAVARHAAPQIRVRKTGPAASIVAVLLTTVAMSLLAARTPAAAESTTTPPTRPTAVVAAAAVTDATTCRVELGDSLWDLAARHLGDPQRWREIYELNHGVVQNDGTTLTRPDLILPGWILTLPGTHSETAAPVGPASPPGPPRAQPSNAGTHLVVQKMALRDRPGVRLPDGGYIGMGLAASFAASLALARLLQRARSTARWPIPLGEQPAPEPPPALATAERAHRAALSPPCVGYFQHGDLPETDEDDPYPSFADHDPTTSDEGFADRPLRSGLSGPAIPVAVRALEIEGDLALGTKGAETVRLDLRGVAGLGFSGPGAADALRALVVGMLANGGPLASLDQMTVLMPAADLGGLFGSELRVPRLRCVADLDAAVDALEAEFHVRRRLLAELELPDAASLRRYYPDQTFEPLVLVATPDDAVVPRLAAILSAGRSVDLHGALLGPWEHGVTVHIDEDGLASSTDPLFDGLSAFTLSEHEACEMIGGLAAPASSRAPVQESADVERFTPVPEPRSSAHTTPAVPASVAVHLPRVAVNILGPVTITVDGREISTYNKVKTVLAYLALHRSGATSDRLLEDVWVSGDGEVIGRPATVRATIYNARTELRNATGEAEHKFVDHRNGRYLLLPDEVETDISRFHRLLDTANRAANDSDRMASLESAIECYRGHLAGNMFADWLLVDREAESRRFGDACCRLSDLALATRPEFALHVLERALADADLNQELYAKIMHIQAKLGRYSEMTKTLRLLEVRMGSLEEEPDQNIYDLFQQLMTSRSAEPV